MTNEMKEFLTKLADLMEEYGANFESYDDSYNYEPDYNIYASVGNGSHSITYESIKIFNGINSDINNKDIRELIGDKK